MHYKQSQEILDRINEGKNILINVHRSPDPDSIGCALAMATTLQMQGKKVTVIAPEKPSLLFDQIPKITQIKVIAPKTFDFSSYDLLILLDTAGPVQFSNDPSFVLPNISTVVLDHHTQRYPTPPGPSIVDLDSASCAEIVFRFFKDTDLPIDPTIATLLLIGVYSDTNNFKGNQTTAAALKTCAELLDLGASYDQVINAVEENLTIEIVNLLGVAGQNLKQEKEGIIWSSLDYQTFAKYGSPDGFTSLAAGKYLNSVKATLFGFMIVEKSPNQCSVSFRSKGGFDCSIVATSLGGGGHPYSSAVRLNGPLEEVKQKVLSAAKAAIKQ